MKLNSQQQKLLRESGELSSIQGFPAIFISGASYRECQTLSAERAISIRVNGKPFSKRGENAGRLRTRKFATCASAEEAADVVEAVANAIRESDTLYGYNILLSSCPDDVSDEDALYEELSRDQVGAVLDQLYQRVYFSRELMRVSKDEWSEVIYRRPEGSR